MDRVTKSLLVEFSNEHELTKLQQEAQFEHFAAYVTVRRHHHGETFPATEIHTGGGGTGIDAIAILVNGSLITDIDTLEDHADTSGHFDVTFVFVQANRGAAFEGAKISNFGFGVNDFFDTQPKLQRNPMISNAAAIMEELYNKGTKFDHGNPHCRLYYATTGTWSGSGDPEMRRVSVEDDLRATQMFRDVEFRCIGGEGLQKLYRQTKNAVVREFEFSKRQLVPGIRGVTDAYIGYVPWPEFVSIVTDDDHELLGGIFYENVRDWQDYTATVNDEIRGTLQSDYKDRFVLMNNGITIIARTLRPLRGDRFQIEDFQIVNGCQTTHVLFDQRGDVDNSIHVPLRIIATQDDGVIKSIIRGTNRQTRVEDDQFFALTDFAEQLEAFFQTYNDPNKLYYERRSGQYARTAITNTRVVTHRNLVRAIGSMFLQVPHQTTRRYSSLRERIGKDIFTMGQKLEPYYISALAAYKLEVAFRTQRIDAKLKSARFHILLAMRLIANDCQLPRLNSNDMVGYCDVIKKILWKSADAESLCANAAKIVEEVAEGDFDRDNIRTQPFTEKVISYFGDGRRHAREG